VLSKLTSLFKKTEPESSTPPSRPVPNTPLEILVPEEAQLSEPPKFAGKFMSYLVAASEGAVTMVIESDSGHVHSSNEELKKFLEFVAGAKQIDTMLMHCKAVMYQPSDDKSIGKMGCMQQSILYSFSVIEHAPLPKLRWEFLRSERPIVG
jgi:hypothetical protein